MHDSQKRFLLQRIATLATILADEHTEDHGSTTPDKPADFVARNWGQLVTAVTALDTEFESGPEAA